MKRLLLSTALLSIFVVACARQESPEVQMSPIEKIRSEVRGLLQEGKTNEVFQVLERGMKDKELISSRTSLFRDIIGLYLAGNRLDAAKSRYLAATNDMELAVVSLGQIESFMINTGRFKELVEWSEPLLSSRLPEPKKADLMSLRLEAHRAQNEFAAVADLIPRIRARFSSQTAYMLADRICASMLRHKQADALAEFLEILEDKHSEQARFPEIVAIYRVKMSLAAGEVKDAMAGFLKTAKLMNDRTARTLFEQIVAAARRAGDLKRADRFVEDVLEDLSPGPQLLVEARRRSVLLAKEMGRADEACSRLGDAMQLSVPVAQKIYLTRNVMYLAMDSGKTKTKKKMMDILSELEKTAEKDRDKADLQTLHLDACFLVEDFDRALKIVSGGVQGMTPEWQDILSVKIQAHKCLKEDRKADAAKYFIEFMDKIKDADESEVSAEDPGTGLRVSKNEVLGLNAARIAGLFRDVKEKDKARQFEAQAKASFMKALEDVEKDTPEYKAIQKQLKDLD